MKIAKTILIGLFWVLIIALLVAPLGLIYQISQAEMEKYKTPEAPVLKESSIGAIVQATKRDVAETVTISGSFTSNTYCYVEMEVENPGLIRWLVSVGEEVQEGQVLGTLNGEEIISTVTGIFVSNNLHSTDSYLKFKLFTPVELSCRVDERTLSILKSAKELATREGAVVKLLFASMQKNVDGTTNVILSIDTDEYQYGEVLPALEILTGRTYRNVIMLPKDCVYQKDAGAGSPWFVRQVTEDGTFIAEREVELGYATDTMVCVSGVIEGTFYDSGYKAVVGG